MRIGLLLASLALLAASAPAVRAAPEEPKARPAARAKLPTNLRGTQTPSSPPPAAPKLAPPPLAALAGPAGSTARSILPSAAPIASAKPDLGQCRTACAHTYYFCLSSPGGGDCSDTWGQCLSQCSYPRITIDR
jgi:hypothetical protein